MMQSRKSADLTASIHYQTTDTEQLEIALNPSTTLLFSSTTEPKIQNVPEQ